MTPQEELQALRRLAELEAKAGSATPTVAASEPLGRGVLEKVGKPQEMSWLEGLAAKGGNIQGSAPGRLIQGLADPPIGLMQIAGNAMGLGDSVNRRVGALEKGYQEQRGMAGSEGFDPLRLTGNIGTSLLVPGVGAPSKGGMLAKMIRGAGTGMAFGAAQPVTSGDFLEEKGKQTGLGGLFGAAGVPIASALARVVRPNTDPAARLLMDEGMNLTPGAILGGGFKRAEDAATSIPVLGDIIRNAQGRSMEDLSRATYKRALDPIGVDASKFPAGPEGVAMVKKALGDKYDMLLPKLSFDVRTIAPDIANLKSMVSQGLPKQEAAQFMAILDKNLGQMPKGVADGKTFKEIVSNLGTEAKSFKGSTDAYQRKLGDALSEAQTAFREGLKLSNPKFAQELAAIDEGYANYVRIRGAAASAGDKSSGFTPGQLSAAVRSADQSVGKGNTATGQALMQDLSDAARQVLPSKVPDSGTPMRSAVGLLAGAGGALAGGNAAIPGLAAGALGPTLGLMGAGGLAALPYTQLGGKAMQKILAERPEFATELAKLLRQGAPIAGAAAAPALTNGL